MSKVDDTKQSLNGLSNGNSGSGENKILGFMNVICEGGGSTASLWENLEMDNIRKVADFMLVKVFMKSCHHQYPIELR